MAKKDNNQLFMSLFYDEDEINLKGPTVEEEEYEFSTGLSTKYTTKVNTIHYTPNGPCPAVSDLYNYKKYLDLLDKINNSSVTEDEKVFLRLAAARHIIFDFGKIANYYAYANKEMQQLMEDSALVIIDFNDAVKNGFVILDKRLDDLINSQLAIEAEEGTLE